MSEQTTPDPDGLAVQAEVLTKLREPFPASAVNLLPKPTKKDNPKGKCDVCGGWHGLPAVHLDYVGHAEVTDRLLSTDLWWNWEPVAMDDHGLPMFSRDAQGRPIGLWIRLTVAGMTRLGYGSVDPGAFDAEKQLIGDAIRNASMRFGVALDLWAKGDLESQKIEPTHDNPSSVASGPRQPNGSAAPASAPVGSGDAHAALMAALPNLGGGQSKAFNHWLRANGLRMPPTTPEDAAAMLAEVRRLTGDGAPFDTAAERAAEKAGSAPEAALVATDGPAATDATPEPVDGHTAPDPVPDSMGPWEPVEGEPTSSPGSWHQWVKQVDKPVAVEWLRRRGLSTLGSTSDVRARMINFAHMRSGAPADA